LAQVAVCTEINTKHKYSVGTAYNTWVLTFRGPFIMMYSYNKSQRDAQLSQIYLIKYSTCFGEAHCPSSGVSQRCMHAIGICHASYVGCLLAWWGSWPW